MASAVYNVNRAKDSPVIHAKDFLPEEPEAGTTDDELADQAATFFERLAMASQEAQRRKGQKPS